MPVDVGDVGSDIKFKGSSGDIDYSQMYSPWRFAEVKRLEAERTRQIEEQQRRLRSAEQTAMMLAAKRRQEIERRSRDAAARRDAAKRDAARNRELEGDWFYQQQQLSQQQARTAYTGGLPEDIALDRVRDKMMGRYTDIKQQKWPTTAAEKAWAERLNREAEHFGEIALRRTHMAETDRWQGIADLWAQYQQVTLPPPIDEGYTDYGYSGGYSGGYSYPSYSAPSYKQAPQWMRRMVMWSF